MSLQTPESGLGVCLAPEGWRDVVNTEEEVDACENLNVVDILDNLNGMWNT
jgi:hypothetical protein